MSEEYLWNSVDLEEGMEYECQIGLLFFRIEMIGKDLWLGYAYKNEMAGSKSNSQIDEEIELEWLRWSFSNPPDQLQIQPYLPDKSMVVHSEYPQYMLPGDKTRIFVGVPATVRINVEREKEQTLLELSSEPLSRTWFGNRVEGELCYWWATRGRRSMPEMKKESHRIGCPVIIQNKSGEELKFDKFCHRVTQLHIYRYQQGLWTDETAISYLGKEEMSEVIASGQLPRELEDAETVSLPREEIRKSIVSRTFLSFI